MNVLSLSEARLDTLLTPEQLAQARVLGLDEAGLLARLTQWLQEAHRGILQGLQGLDMTLFLATVGGTPTDEYTRQATVEEWRRVWEQAGEPDGDYTVLLPVFEASGLPRNQWVRAVQQMRFWHKDKAARIRREWIVRLLNAGAGQKLVMSLLTPAVTWDEFSEAVEGLDFPVFPRSMSEAESHALYRVWEGKGYAEDTATLLAMAEASGHGFQCIRKQVLEWLAVRRDLERARTLKKHQRVR